MFRTLTVHPQELLRRYCMCRLWYVLIRPAGTTFEEELLPQTLYRRDVSAHAIACTYGIYKEAPEDGALRSEACRADTWVLINNKCKYIVYLVGMYICIYIAKNDTRTFNCQTMFSCYLSVKSGNCVMGVFTDYFLIRSDFPQITWYVKEVAYSDRRV